MKLSISQEFKWYNGLEFEKWVAFLNRDTNHKLKERMLAMTLADYSDLEKEISNAPDPKTLPRGAEVKVRIIDVREGISDKNDAQWYQPLFDVPSDPMVVEFNDFFWDLSDRDKLDAKQAERAMNKFKKFASAFGLDYSRPFNWIDDLIGLEGWIIVGTQKDDEYGLNGIKNNVSKYVEKK